VTDTQTDTHTHTGKFIFFIFIDSKQDRHIHVFVYLTLLRSWLFLGAADSVAAFRSSPRLPVGWSDRPFSGTYSCRPAFYCSGDVFVEYW